MNRLFTYRVTGTWPFPLDMLRYDCAWPATEQDAGLMHRSLDMTSHRPADGTVTISISSYREPTAGRWASFGWKVER